MAFRAANYAKSMMSRLRGSTAFATSTSPKMIAYSPTIDWDDVYGDIDTKPRVVKGEYVPVSMSLGLILLSVSFGTYTLMHHAARNPSVSVKKSRRETLPELVEPEEVVQEADRFINKSFFRNLAHIQDFHRQLVIPDPIHGNIYFCKHPEPRAVTLKDVGVEVEKKPFVQPPPIKH